MFLLTFCGKLNVVASVDYFILQICWRWVENFFLKNVMVFNPFKTKIKYNIPIINVKTKTFLWK